MPTINSNGVELFYRTVGSGPPCLMMHGGLGMDHTHLSPWLDRLSSDFELIYYDMRGNGRSGRPPVDELTFENFCADADALREHLGHSEVAVFGQSYGGMLAMDYARRFPDRVNRLILSGTLSYFEHLDELVADVRARSATEEEMEALLAEPADDRELEETLRKVARFYYHRFDPVLADRVFAETIWCAETNRRSNKLLETESVRPYLGEIHVPALVLVGAGDVYTPVRLAQELADELPKGELTVIDEAGHMPYVEQPEAYFDAIHSWLRRTA